MNHAEENADWMVRLHEAIIDGKPAELAPEELPDDPLFVEQIRHCLTTLENLRWSAVETKGEHTSATESLGLAAAHSIDHQAVIQDLAGQSLRIGRFDLVREIGRGGHGIVYLARDPVLKREVAIKILSAAVLASPQLRKRFVREGQAAAALRHPNILAVYEAGEAGSTAYLVQAYCRGPNLATWLREQVPSVAPRVAAQITRQLAHGVEHSHSQGVLHRDLKPGNVLLEPCATGSPDDLSFVPQLVDFGLARFEQEDQQHTRTGTVLGTVNYMAPEQVRGASEQIDRPTDVYGLGAILYELLTGMPPFQGDHYPDTFRRICEEDPIPPARVRRDIPADLTAICLKALEKAPGRRYPTAAAMAADLRRYLDGEPTLARPATAWQQAEKWSRRHPSWVALIGVSVLAIVSLVAGSIRYNAQLRTAAQLAEERRIAAEKSELVSRQLLYAADLRAAQQAWNQGRAEDARQLLAGHIPAAGKPDLREFTWRYLWQLANQHLLTFRGHQGAVYQAVLSRDEKTVATCGQDGTVRLWDAETAASKMVFRDSTAEVNVIEYNPEGTLLAAAGDDGIIRIYGPVAGKLLHSLPSQGSGVNALRFAYQHPWLATGGKNRKVTLWNTDTWTPIAEFGPHDDTIESLAFSTYDTLLAAGEKDVKIWDTETRQLNRTLTGLKSSMTSVKFSEYDLWLVGGCRDHTAAIWDLKTDQPPQILAGHRGAIHSIDMSHFRRWLATASADGTVGLWDPQTGSRVKTFVGHVGEVWSVRFTPYHRAILTASSDGTAKLCKLAEPYRIVRDTLTSIQSDVQWKGLAFSKNGEWFSAAGSGQQQPACCIVRSRDEFQLMNLPVQYQLLETGFFEPSGLCIAWNHMNKVYTYNMRTGEMRTLTVPGKPTDTPCAIQAAGSSIVLGGMYPLAIWDVPNQQQIGSLAGPKEVRVEQLRFDQQGKTLAVSQSDGRIRIWDFASRTLLSDFASGWQTPPQLAFCSNGDILAGGSDGTVRRWSSQGESAGPSFPAQAGKITALAVSPDGVTLATGSEQGVSVGDFRTRERLITLCDKHAARRLLFSPDGTILLGGFANGELFLWRADSGSRSTADTNVPLPNLWQNNSAPAESSGVTDHAVLPISVPEGLHDLPTRFRRLDNWSRPHGHRIAIPTYEDRETDEGVLLGGLAVSPEAVETVHTVFFEELAALSDNENGLQENELLQRRLSMWASLHGFAACSPTFQLGEDQRKKLLTMAPVFTDRVVEVRSVRRAELGDDFSYPGRLRSIQAYARAQGFAGGFPSYVDEPKAGKIGVVLLKSDIAKQVSIPAEELR